MQEKCYMMPGREVPVLGDVDVVVVGGGFPGVCAAVGSARAGAKVAVVERDGMLGGQAAEIYTFGLDGFVDNNGRQFVKGIPWEVIQRTLSEGQSDPVWSHVDYGRMEREGIEAEIRRFAITPSRIFKSQTYINPNAFRYVLQVLLDEEEVTTFLESSLSDVLLDGERVKGVVAMGCYGPFAVAGKVVVDTTPQAAVAALAGRPFPYPRVYTGTHPRVAGVDIHQLLGYMEANPDDVNVVSMKGKWKQMDTEFFETLIDRDIALLMSGFTRARQRAVADDPAYEVTGRGDECYLTFFYDRDGCGEYWVHSRKWRDTSLDDPLHLSRTITEYRKNQWLTHKLFRDYVPGFEKAQLMDIHPHIARALLISKEPGGFTEFDIPWEHIEKDGNLYEDSIARVMGHPDRAQGPEGFQVPLRSLIPRGLKGLLVTGKPACRFLHYHGTNAAIGQAAGVAAAVAAKDGVPLRELPVAKVQDELKKQGAVVL